MDTLKGKQIMVWTFMGNARMYEALRDYGDRISQIGLFSFKVRATGEIYESGVAISDMLTYINKWPHIKWLLTVANDGANSIFRALRDNTNGAQEMFLSEIIRIMEKYPWCDGIDIDLERGDGYSTHAASTAMFQNIYNTVKNYDATKHMNICLPGMTSVNGSVGGENWCVYGDLDAYCDTASIMSYGMAWAGSAPGPVSPRSWLEGIYDYATQVMDPDKIFLGMPAYGWNWQIYDTPENLGETYRGVSNTYYAARYWMTGAYNFTGDAPPQPFLPIVAYWDDYDKVPYAFPHVYDYMEGADAVSREYPQLADTYNRRRYLTAYGKEQKTEFGTIFIDRDADGYSSASGIVSIENGIATLGDNGSVTYSFTVNAAGTYDVAVRLCYVYVVFGAGGYAAVGMAAEANRITYGNWRLLCGVAAFFIHKTISRNGGINMKELWNTAQVIFAAIGGWLGYFLGGCDGLLIALVVFVAVDYVTGVMCAISDKKLSSEVGFKGICRKVLIFLLVGIANIVDVQVVGTGSVLRTAVIFFYLSNEGVSLLENAAHLGLPVPEKMKDILAQLHDRAEKEEN